ncbi:MAG TPA: SH3 domain-containing protein [Thermomicrobiales bacterium]|nr:SH3 domain-containing protein [Thermomicrobiales bacterium]
MTHGHPRIAGATQRRTLAVLAAFMILTSAAAVVPAPRKALAASARTTSDLNLRTAPSLNSTVILVMPSGASVEVLGSPDDGFYPVSYGGTRGYAYGEFLSIGSSAPPPAAGPGQGSARTTTDLNLRSGPSLSAGVLAVMPGGAAVTITGSSQNGYVPVTYGGTSGWAYASYLTSGGSGTPEPEPASPPVSGPSGTAVTTAALNLRSGPNLTSNVLAVMPYGASVALTGQSSGEFHATRYQGIDGWAHRDFLRLGTAPQPTTPPSAPAPTQEPAPEQGPTGTAYTTTDLNLRSGPSTSTGVVAVMPRGAAVTLTGQSQAGFSSVRYNGASGWAYATYLTTTGPPAPAPTTPPPSGGGGNLTQEQIIAIIYAAADRYGQSRADMLRVARCESVLDPNAVNPAGSYGLFQFIRSTWASTPYAAYDIFDPWANANAAGWMWSVGRRNEWVCQ